MAFVASIGDTKIGRRLGYRRFAFMEHGAGQAYIGQAGPNGRNPSYPGGVDREDTELFLVPNEYSAALWRAPTPTLASRSSAARGSTASPAASSTRSRPGPRSPCRSTGPPTSARRRAPPSARSARRSRPRARFHVIGHAHPKGDWPTRMKRIYRQGGDRVRPRLRRGLPAGGPVRGGQQLDDVRVRRDRPPRGGPERARLPAQRQPRLRFWDAAHVGVNVDAPGDLAPSVERALEDGGDLFADREDALGIVYAYRTGAAPRAADALSEWVGTTVPRAA
jgi:hypothetical protein